MIDEQLAATQKLAQSQLEQANKDGNNYPNDKPCTEEITIKEPDDKTVATIQMVGKTKTQSQHAQPAKPLQEDTYHNKTFTIDDLTNTEIKLGHEFYVDTLNNVFYKLQTGLTNELANKANKTGATAVISFLVGDELYTGSLGDSSAFLLRQDQIQQLNIRHNPDKKYNSSEVERIQKAGGAVTVEDKYSNRLKFGATDKESIAVSRAFGDNALVESGLIHIPDITCVKIESGCKLVQCTDGVTDYLPPFRIQELTKQDESIQNAAVNIAKEVAQCGAHDNTTIQVMNLEPLASGQMQLFCVFDGHGGDAVSQYLAKNVSFVFEETLKEQVEHVENNKKYNAILSKKNADSSRDLYQDVKESQDEFYHLFAKLFQQDPEFAATLTADNLESHDKLREKLKSSNSSGFENNLSEKNKFWEARYRNLSEKYKPAVKKHIYSIKKLAEDIKQYQENNNNAKTDSELLALQVEHKKIKERTSKLTQEEVVLNKTFELSGAFIPMDLNRLKEIREKRAQEAKKESRGVNRPAESSFPPDKTVHVSKQVNDNSKDKKEDESFAKDQRGQLFRSEPSDNKSYRVLLNKKLFSKEELAQIRRGNTLFNNALNYFDTIMQDGATAYMHNALHLSVITGKTTLNFEEIDGELYCFAECLDYQYQYDNQNFHSLPGSTTTVYKFNNQEGQKGFEWVSLSATTTLLARLIDPKTSNPQTVSNSEIEEAKREAAYAELVRALSLLKAKVTPGVTDCLILQIYYKIIDIKNAHFDIADFQLLTKVALAVVAAQEVLTDGGVQPDFSHYLSLLSEVHDKYDSFFFSLLIGFLFIAGVLSILTGAGILPGLGILGLIAEPLLATATEAFIAGGSSVVGSVVAYAYKEKSKTLAETQLSEAAATTPVPKNK